MSKVSCAETGPVRQSRSVQISRGKARGIRAQMQWAGQQVGQSAQGAANGGSHDRVNGIGCVHVFYSTMGQ